MSNDMLLGSAMQLIKDIEKISFLGERMECLKINQMAKDWLKRLDAEKEGADVATVRHARWVDNHCTACGMMPMGDEMWKHLDLEPPLFERFMDYCPNCGAKMDVEEV